MLAELQENKRILLASLRFLQSENLDFSGKDLLTNKLQEVYDSIDRMYEKENLRILAKQLAEKAVESSKTNFSNIETLVDGLVTFSKKYAEAYHNARV